MSQPRSFPPLLDIGSPAKPYPRGENDAWELLAPRDTGRHRTSALTTLSSRVSSKAHGFGPSYSQDLPNSLGSAVAPVPCSWSVDISNASGEYLFQIISRSNSNGALGGQLAGQLNLPLGPFRSQISKMRCKLCISGASGCRNTLSQITTPRCGISPATPSVINRST